MHSDGPANSSGGSGFLSTIPPQDEPADNFIYDPADPVPTLGGSTLIIPHGVMDQNSVELRQDVLVYTTDPLSQELEITGPIGVTLYAASTATDTDFTAKLVEVRPDGYAQNLQDGIVRARFRTSAAQPAFLTPGQVYRFDIDLWSTSHLVRAGHRIRVRYPVAISPGSTATPTPAGLWEPMTECRKPARRFTIPQHFLPTSPFPSSLAEIIFNVARIPGDVLTKQE